MLRKLFSDPALLILTLAVGLAIFLLMSASVEKRKLTTDLARMNQAFDQLADVQPGDLAPEISGQDEGGKPFRIRNGHKRIILAYGVDCRACVEQLPFWQQLSQAAQSRGYEPIIVLVTSPNGLKTIPWRNTYTFKTLIPDPKDFMKGYRVRSLPKVLAIDETGRVNQILDGSLDQNKIDEFLRQTEGNAETQRF
jgi:hypothetical protein